MTETQEPLTVTFEGNAKPSEIFKEEVLPTPGYKNYCYPNNLSFSNQPGMLVASNFLMPSTCRPIQCANNKLVDNGEEHSLYFPEMKKNFSE